MTKLLRTVFLLWLAACGAVLAQEAPPCPCPEPPPPPDPLWFGKLNFSFLSTSGNTDTTSIGGAAEVNYNPKPFLFTLKGAYLYSQTDGEVTAESSAASMRGSFDITPRFYVFAGAGYLRNTFSGIDALWSIDGGAGFKICDGPTQFLRAEGGVGWTNETDIILGRRPDPPAATPTRAPASTTSGSSRRTLPSRTISRISSTSTTPQTTSSPNRAAITADISKIFALQASWTLLWRNQPVLGFGHTDTATAVGIVAAF